MNHVDQIGILANLAIYEASNDFFGALLWLDTLDVATERTVDRMLLDQADAGNEFCADLVHVLAIGDSELAI